MAVEEVVLWAPGDRNGEADLGPDPSATDGVERVVREYVKRARARDGFALGERMRQVRHERFDVAVKTLVKAMATEAARSVPDRTVRLEVRKDVYACMMALTRTMARDHLMIIRRGRRSLRWGLGLAGIGLISVLLTLMANGWIPTGWLG